MWPTFDRYLIRFMHAKRVSSFNILQIISVGRGEDGHRTLNQHAKQPGMGDVIGG